MCYSIYISTTTDEDLAALPSTLFRFERDPEAETPAMRDLLAHPHRWFLTGQGGGCSCHFRHVMGESDFGFGPPVDWYPEDEDDVESTHAVYEVFARVVNSGHQVDVVDMWSDMMPQYVDPMEVSLSQVPAESFRFFDGKRFILRP
ncbi:MAG: hypothetical protein ACHQ50_15835 [Fimbriimonadales bacterium]